MVDVVMRVHLPVRVGLRERVARIANMGFAIGMLTDVLRVLR